MNHLSQFVADSLVICDISENSSKVVTKVLWNNIECMFKQKNYCEMILSQEELSLTADNFIHHFRAASNASDVGELIIYVPQEYSGSFCPNNTKSKYKTNLDGRRFSISRNKDTVANRV